MNIARDVLLDSRARQRGVTDHAGVSRLLDAHASGTIDGSDAIWSLLNLELWYRTFIDGEGVQTLSLPPAMARTSGLEPQAVRLSA